MQTQGQSQQRCLHEPRTRDSPSVLQEQSRLGENQAMKRSPLAPKQRAQPTCLVRDAFPWERGCLGGAVRETVSVGRFVGRVGKGQAGSDA